MRPVITLRGTAFTLHVPLGVGPPSITGGGATWEEVSRPERDPLTDFVGNSLITVEVPVLFDGWPRENVGPEVRQILDLSRGWHGNRPPHFTAEGPFPYSGREFVMRIPTMGASLLSDGGALVRQEMTLQLLEWVDPNNVRWRKKNGKHSHPAKGIADAIVPPATFTLTRPESLLEISTRYLNGGAKRAHVMGKINGIRDITRKLPKGKTINLPRVEELDEAEKA